MGGVSNYNPVNTFPGYLETMGNQSVGAYGNILDTEEELPDAAYASQ